MKPLLMAAALLCGIILAAFDNSPVVGESPALNQGQMTALRNNLRSANQYGIEFAVEIADANPGGRENADGAVRRLGLPDNAVLLIFDERGGEGRLTAVFGDYFNRRDRRRIAGIVEHEIADYFIPEAQSGAPGDALVAFSARLISSAPTMLTNSWLYTYGIICGTLALAILLLVEYRTRWRLRLAAVLAVALAGLLVYLAFSLLLPAEKLAPVECSWGKSSVQVLPEIPSGD